MCAATSTPSRRGCPARRCPTRWFMCSPWPPGHVCTPGWVGSRPPISPNGTACADAGHGSIVFKRKTMTAKIRKLLVQVDETRSEMGQDINPPTRRAVAMAVIENPYAGRYEQNLDALIAIGEELGALLGEKCVAALGINPAQAESYGKAAIVGEAGELEHAA